MSILGDAFTSSADMLNLLAKYGPAIEALIQFIELQADEKKRAVAFDGITRGLQYASQTGNTTLLESAIRAHITASGLPIP